MTTEDGSKLPARATRTAVTLAAAALCSTAAAQPPPVTVAQPQPHDFELVSAQPSTAEAFYEADLGAKVSGYVSELLVDIGSRVREGQVLARLTVPELIQARNAAAAEVAAVQSEHERIAMLAERNSVTQKSLTEAKSRLDMAVARRAEIEAEMAYATIEAPFGGVVTARTIDPGDMVYEASSPKGGDQPLLRVAKVDVIRVKTYVPERDSRWVDIGDPVTVVFDALAGRVFEGAIARFSDALDPRTRTMLVEVDLPNDDGRLRPGLYGQARVLLERRTGALALPAAAVRTDASGAFVLTVSSGDVVRRAPVEVGLESGGWVEIASGLTGTERVVVSGPASVADGATVRVTGS
jgi:RND family efflux transporter MFP subunit